MFQFKANSLLKNNSYTSMLKKENSIINKIKSHISMEDIYKSPLLSTALRRNKKIRFNLLTSNDYKVKSISVNNDKKQHLIDNINSFRKIYFNYNKSVKYSLDEMNNMSKENREFTQRYNQMKRLRMPNRLLFSDIKGEYEKQNYVLPKLEENNNLFKQNLLLSNNDTDLQKFIRYGYGTSKSNNKSLSFLRKMDNELNDDLKDESQIFAMNFANNPNIIFRRRRNYMRISKSVLKEWMTYKKDIRRVQKTIDSLQDIDYFFNSDNKDYLDTLRYFDSGNTSANYSTSLGNNNSSVFDKLNRVNNKTKRLSLRNISKYTSDENDKTKNRNSRFFGASTINNFSGSNSLENKSLAKLIKKPKKKKKIQKKYITRKNYKKTLETLYNKIITSDDSSIFDKKIKNYLKFRRYQLEPKITRENICNNVEQLREKICKDNSIKRLIYFRKNIDSTYTGDININKKENELAKKFHKIEDQIVQTFSTIKN